MALQKQSDGSYITVQDNNTRALPSEFYRYENDPNPRQVYTTGDRALNYDTYKSMGGTGQMGQEFADVQVRQRTIPSAQPKPQATPQPTSQQDPVTAFNMAIMNMLQQAQSGSGNADLFKQQRALQRASIDRTAQITPEELRLLSPDQQAAIRSGSVQALEPEIDALAAEIKARDSRLANFESTLGQMRSIGLDIAANLTPPKEVVEGYKNLIRMTGDLSAVPAEIRSKVVGSLSPEDWKGIETQQQQSSRSGDIQKLALEAGISDPFLTLNGTTYRISDSKAYHTREEAFADGVAQDFSNAPDVTQKLQAQEQATTRISSSSSSSNKSLPASDAAVRNWILANKRENPDVPYYDLWGQLADELKAQGLNPSNYDQIFWELLHPEGLAGYKKYSSASSSSSDLP